MATKRIARKATPVRRFSTQKVTRKLDTNHSLLRSFRISESYTSLILGIFVVIISSLLLVSFLRNRNIGQINQTKQDISSTRTTANQGRTYTVVAGDDLWKIAERTYNNGYNWVDIAKANNIENPGDLKVGTKLTLPKLTPTQLAQNTTPTVQPTQSIPTPTQVAKQAQPTNAMQQASPSGQTQENFGEKIVTATYRIKPGDHLWGIAVRAYGDGYKWVEVARANNIQNPDLIYPDTELKLPRG